MNIEIQGLPDYSIDEVKSIIEDYIKEIIDRYNLDAEIIDIELHGSRLRGTARKDSDLDVVVEYVGNEREDDMFNILNDDEDRLYIEHIKVDINPIREEETGNMKDYMIKSKKYDKEILNENKNF